jgi:hypothetical protein
MCVVGLEPKDQHGPPDGGREHLATGSINMAPLAVGRAHLATGSINMALLIEGGRILPRF